jgi:hypothetical protein
MLELKEIRIRKNRLKKNDCNFLIIKRKLLEQNRLAQIQKEKLALERERRKIINT